MNTGSDSTLIAVASIPPHIWEQDYPTWKAWVTSIDVSFHTKQGYKRYIATFYESTNKPIAQTTEDDIERYIAAHKANGKAENTIKRYMTPIRAYWRFAQTH